MAPPVPEADLRQSTSVAFGFGVTLTLDVVGVVTQATAGHVLARSAGKVVGVLVARQRVISCRSGVWRSNVARDNDRGNRREFP